MARASRMLNPASPEANLPVKLPESLSKARGAAIVGACVALETFATLFFILRVISRFSLLRVWKLEDWLLSITWSISVTLTVLTGIQICYGPGPSILTTTITLYQIVLAVTKLSICCFYLRALALERRVCILIYCCIAFILLYSVPVVVFNIVWCTLWNKNPPPDPTKTCIDVHEPFYIAVVGNKVTDVWLILAVLPPLLKLRLRLKQKVASLVVVSLDWLVVAASIMRAVRISMLFEEKGHKDLWAVYEVNIWSAVEVNLGIFCAAAPASRPLLAKLTPSVFSLEASEADRNEGALKSIGPLQSTLVSKSEYIELQHREDPTGNGGVMDNG